MATNLGQAYVQIMPSARGIKGSIQKQLDPEAQSSGGSAGRLIGGKLVGALAGIVAAAKIGEMIVGGIKASISEGAALQQSLGGIETLFKNNANKVKAYAKEAYRTTGLSANAYMETVTGFSASLLQSLGGDTSKAADVANMAMIDMSDNANKMGTSMELIQNAYQGFAKQNYTMLDNLKLGYGGTKEEMQRLLSDAEKLTGQKYDISNLSDVYNAIHAIQGQLDITGTTAKEASSTFTGSFTAMKSAAQNLLGHLAIGESITDDLKALTSTTSTFLFNNFLPMVGNILKGLPTIFAFAIKDLFPKAVEAGKAFLNQLGIGIDSGTSQSLAKVKGVVESLISTVKSAFSKLKFDGLKDFLDSILPALSAGFEKVATIAGPALESVITFVSGGDEVAYISQGVLHIDNGIFAISVQIGHFITKQHPDNEYINMTYFVA